MREAFAQPVGSEMHYRVVEKRSDVHLYSREASCTEPAYRES